jgi:hypothetical protein
MAAVLDLEYSNLVRIKPEQMPEKLTLNQLQDMAKRNNLKGYSSLNKTALINKLNGLIKAQST